MYALRMQAIGVLSMEEISLRETFRRDFEQALTMLNQKAKISCQYPSRRMATMLGLPTTSMAPPMMLTKR